MDKDSTKKQQNDNDLMQEQQYKVGQIVFTVNPVFKDDGKDTLTSALIRLMRNDIDNQ